MDARIAVLTGARQAAKVLALLHVIQHVLQRVQANVQKLARDHVLDLAAQLVKTPVVQLARSSNVLANYYGKMNEKDAWADITFIVTKDCQLACRYCYLVGKNSNERMSFEVAKQAIDFILSDKRMQQYGGVVWDFIGGEPFLEIELIDLICDYLKKEMFKKNHHWFNNYRFSFTTNGINYHDEKVQNFINKNLSHLSIGITIDGDAAKHDLNRIYKHGGRGSYHDVVRNIPLWLEQFPDEGTKVTISSDDIPYICQSVMHLYALGIHKIHINTVFENVWKDGDDDIFLQQLLKLADTIIDNDFYAKCTCSLFSEDIGKPLDPLRDNQNWCGAGMMLSVDATGNFYPCTRFAGYSLRSKKPIIIGNVRDGIDKNKLRPFLTLDRTTQSPRECIDCEVASGCAWCQGENYDAADTNTIYQRSTAICKMHQARVRANNYYWNKLYRKLELEGKCEDVEKNKREMKPEIC